jgi:hypothetical protein
MLHADRLDAGFLDKPNEVHELRILHCASGRMLWFSNASPAHDIDPVKAIEARISSLLTKPLAWDEEEFCTASDASEKVFSSMRLATLKWTISIKSAICSGGTYACRGIKEAG